MKNNQSGFSALESILILVLISTISFAGWYVWRAKDATEKTLDTTNSAADKTTNQQKPDNYAGWQTATLSREKLSFKYPADWELKDTSYDNSDLVVLTGPNNFTVDISAGGLGKPNADTAQKVLFAEAVKFLGQTGYLDYVSSAGNQTVGYVSLSQSKTDPLDTFKTKNAGDNDTPGGNFLIKAMTDTNVASPTLEDAKVNKNYVQLKLIIESMRY